MAYDSEQNQAPDGFALIVLSTCYFTLAVASLSVVGLLTPMAGGLQVSESSIAYLVTAFAMTYALAAPALQMAVGDWDRKTLIIGGLAAIACGCVVTSIATDYWIMVLGRVLMASGAAVLGPMASAAGAALVAPEKRGAALGTVFAGLTVASVIGVPATAWLGDQIGWRATMVTIAALALCVAAAIWLSVPGGGRGERSNARAILDTLMDRTLAPALSVTLFQMAGQFCVYAVVAVYIIEHFGVAPALVPLGLFAYGIGGIVGNIIATRLIDRLGADRLIRISLVATTIVALIVQLAPQIPALAFVLMASWSVCSMMVYAPQQARLINLAPRRANLLLALNGAGLYVGMAVGAAISGTMFAASRTEWLALASAALFSVALVTFLVSVRRQATPG